MVKKDEKCEKEVFEWMYRIMLIAISLHYHNMLIKTTRLPLLFVSQPIPSGWPPNGTVISMLLLEITFNCYYVLDMYLHSNYSSVIVPILQEAEHYIG